MPVVIGAAAENGFTNPIGLLSDCHRRIERFLKTLEAVADLGGVLDAPCRKALKTALEYFRNAAPRHTADEEEDLFPMLRLRERPEIAKALERLEGDHARASAWHREVEEIFGRWVRDERLPAPETARLKDLLKSLSDLYAAHITVEEDSIFPLAQAELSAQDKETMGRRMASRRGVPYDGSTAGRFAAATEHRNS
jgi:hemerythrin-like domain-containing protein